MRLRQGGGSALDRARWSLHLSRCPPCLAAARALPKARRRDVLGDPLATAVLHLSWGEPLWSELGGPLGDALRWVGERPVGFLFLLVEEAARAALSLRRPDLFELPATIVEMAADGHAAVETRLVLARLEVRRAEVEARLGQAEAATARLSRVESTGAGLGLEDEVEAVRELLAADAARERVRALGF